MKTLQEIKDKLSFINKFDLKPQNQNKITLFANKAEAIVFWLSLAGLIFLAIISLFRFLSQNQSDFDKAFKEDLLSRIETLEMQNELIKSQNDSLKNAVKGLEAKLETDAKASGN